MPKFRTIIEQPLVSVRVDQTKAEHPYFDEYFEDGLKWWLARKPLTGKRVPGLKDQFVVEAKLWMPRRIPPVRLLYSVTKDESVIESMAVYDND